MLKHTTAAEDSLSNTHLPADGFNEFIDISFYAELSASDTIEDFRRKVLSLVRKMGFSDFLFKVITRENIGTLTSFSPEIYQKSMIGYAAYKSVLLQHLEQDNTPIFLSQITDFARHTPIKTRVFQLSHQFLAALQAQQFNDAYCLSRKAPSKGKKMLFLLADKHTSKESFREKILHRQPLLHLLGEAIAVTGHDQFPEYFLGLRENMVFITPKPLHLLNMLAKQNITLKDAAKELNISLDTANKHIAAAKDALGAKTLTSTIYKAIKEGIIEVDS